MAYVRIIIGVLIVIGVLAGILTNLQVQRDEEAGSVLKDSFRNENKTEY